jgi:phospholipid transport system transporter-binding protein
MIETAGERMQVVGPMVIASAAKLKTEGEAALAAGVTEADLAGVTDADSSAIAVLLAWTRAAQQRGQRLAVANPPDGIRSLAALYGVAELLSLG